MATTTRSVRERKDRFGRPAGPNSIVYENSGQGKVRLV